MHRFIPLLFFALLAAVPAAEGQWVQTNGPFGSGSKIQCLAASGSNLFAGTYGGGIFLSTDNGLSWNGVNAGLTGTVNIVNAIAVHGATIFAGSQDKGIFVSTDNGNSWTTSNNALTGSYITAFAEIDSNIFAGTYGGGVFLLNDTGWKGVNTGLTNNLVWSLAERENNLFVGTSYGGIFLSSDNGMSWQALNNGLDDSISSVLALAASPTTIFAGIFDVDTYIGGIFISLDNGTGWEVANNGLPISFPFAVRAFTLSGNSIFAGTNSGVFLSTNEGASWIQVDSGLSNAVVNALAISDNNLFAGTDSCVYRRPLSDFGISSVASQPTIQENILTFPNPFSSHTQISFTASESGYAEISIVNALGAEVTRLYAGELDAGNHSFAFDGSNVMDGNYWCVVRMNGHVETLPIAIVR